MVPPDGTALIGSKGQYESVRAYVAEMLSLVPGKLALALVLMLCVGLMESIGLLLLVPLLDLLGLDVGQGTTDRISRTMAAILATLGLAPALPLILLIYTVVVAARALLHRWHVMAIADLQSTFVRRLRQRLFKAILHARWLWFSQLRRSDVLHVLTAQANRVGYATDHLLPLAAQLLIVSVYLLFAFTVSPVVTTIVLTSGVALLLTLRADTRRALALGEQSTAVGGRLYGAIMEQLGALKAARSYNAQERTADLFRELQDDIVAAQMKAQRIFSRVRLRFEIGAVLALSLMLYVSIELLPLAVAEVLLLVFLFGRVVPRFSSAQQSYQYFMNALPAFRDLMQMIAISEREAEPELRHGMAPTALDLRDSVRLRNIVFRYPSHDDRVTIDDVNLDIPAHCMTAIVGPSGAGKSTIADIVLGLIRPDRGTVYVDDVVLGPATLRAWREHIGYVPQEGFLFHDSVRANLLWAKPEATDDELREALRLASADHFVDRLADGIDTIIGDCGVLLAGGERQRLALARAILRRPTLLVLDEATNALDSENERHIQQALKRLHGRLTTLLITHRLTSVRDADLIHVIEAGRVVESGTWPELLRAGGRFVDLCRAQRITTHSTQPMAPSVAAGIL